MVNDKIYTVTDEYEIPEGTRRRTSAGQKPQEKPAGPSKKRLSLCLFLLRLSVFAVLLVWTLDKFIRPEHASQVFEEFYYIKGMANFSMYMVGIVEMVIIVLFFIGFYKGVSYPVVLLLHTISTASSYAQFMEPFKGGNIMFFAAWPILAALLVLYLLREYDTWSLNL